VQAIALASALPVITVASGGLTIDGTTQPGYAGAPVIAADVHHGFSGFVFAGSRERSRASRSADCQTAVNSGLGDGPIVVKACHIGVDRGRHDGRAERLRDLGAAG
jgi:hypothetical protein